MPEPKSTTPPAIAPKDDKLAIAPAVSPTPVSDIKSNVQLIERAVSTLEPRFTHRVLRALTTLRKRLDGNVLKEALATYPKGAHAFLVSREK